MNQRELSSLVCWRSGWQTPHAQRTKGAFRKEPYEERSRICCFSYPGSERSRPRLQRPGRSDHWPNLYRPEETKYRCGQTIWF